MNTSIYNKTDKGREEIATRKYRVAPRLRTLLVMIDGRQPLGSLLTNFAALGLNHDCVTELVEQDYIRLVSGGPAASVPAAPQAARPPASARARMQARVRAAAQRSAQPGAPAPSALAAAEE
jgi:hypothetical protein